MISNLAFFAPLLQSAVYAGGDHPDPRIPLRTFADHQTPVAEGDAEQREQSSGCGSL